MSVDQDSLAAMTKDELIDEIAGMNRRLTDLQEFVYETMLPRLQEAESENEDLRERLAALEGRVDPNPASKTYQDKDRPELVQELRVALCRRATSNNGKAAMDYNNVLSLFNEHPSDGYAYKLMKIAADYDPETKRSNYDGFTYTARGDANDQLRVDLEDVNDDAVLHAVNNGRDGKGGR